MGSDHRRHSSTRRIAALSVVVGLLASALTVLGSPSPASAATIDVHNGSTTGTWVDGSGRFHVLWSNTSPAGVDPQVDHLTVARHTAGTADLDPTFGAGGRREIPLDNPYRWDSGSPGLYARVTESGFTADGTIVVAWLATGFVELERNDKKVTEWSHDRDRLVIDRYDLGGTRLSRVDVPMPRNSWCSNTYAERVWSEDFQQWVSAHGDFCGEYSEHFPSIDLLPSGVLAVPTTGHYQWAGGEPEPEGTSSLVLIHATTGATLRTVPMPWRHWERGHVTGHADGGAVMNTYETTTCDGDGCEQVEGPTYVVAADWTSVRTVTSPVGCELFAGANGGTIKTCRGAGTLDVTAAGPTGATLWTRSIPAARSALALAVQPDGRVSVVGHGCVDPAAPCGTFNVVGLRFGPSGDIDRADLGETWNATTGSDYTWDAPRTLPDGRQAAATDHRRNDASGDHTIVTRILDSVATPPTCTTGPPIVTVSTRGTTTVTFRPCEVTTARSLSGARAGEVTGYVVEAVNGSGAVAASVTVAPGQTSASVTGLSVGERYRFRVRARNDAGLGPASAFSSWTTPGFVSFTSFVNRQYADLVGRKPTSTELRAAVDALAAGTTTPVAFIDKLVGGTWVAGRVGQANRLARTVLVRDLTSTSLSTYVGRLRAGTTLTTIATGWMGSAEYKQRYGGLTNRAFIEALYRNVYGRAGTASSVATWTKRLDTRTHTRAQVLVAFSESAEHKTRTAARHHIFSAYFGLLRRVPTSSALTTWLPKMTGPTPRQPIIASILRGAEYDALVP